MNHHLTAEEKEQVVDRMMAIYDKFFRYMDNTPSWQKAYQAIVLRAIAMTGMPYNLERLQQAPTLMEYVGSEPKTAALITEMAEHICTRVALYEQEHGVYDDAALPAAIERMLGAIYPLAKPGRER